MENSFLQQLVNVLDIVKRVVDEEAQLGDNSQLVSHARTQFVAYGFLVSRDVLYQSSDFSGGNMLRYAVQMLRSGLMRQRVTLTIVPSCLLSATGISGSVLFATVLQCGFVLFPAY